MGFVEKEKDILQSVLSQLFYNELNFREDEIIIRNILRNNQTLLMIDGLNGAFGNLHGEYSSLFQGKIFENAWLIVTSRPLGKVTIMLHSVEMDLNGLYLDDAFALIEKYLYQDGHSSVEIHETICSISHCT